MRSGVISTPHGNIKTPAFIPVGTRAAIKGVLPEQMANLGAQALLANAYHLNLKPGSEIIDLCGGNNDGGLAKFMNWKLPQTDNNPHSLYAPTFTDSGGFQVMSLGVGFKKVIAMSQKELEEDAKSNISKNRKESLATIDNDGVTFKSHIDGSMHRFTPEISMKIQHQIGADIIFSFDELTTLTHPKDYHKESLITRTHPWAQRSLDEHQRLTQARPNKPYQMLYGVLQGANIQELRRMTAKHLALMTTDNPDQLGGRFDGFGIGGAFEKEILADIISWCSDELNKNGAESKPRHLLGISGLTDLFEGVENGMDTFDCVSPSREARNGAVYTKKYGRINIKNAQYQKDFTPIDSNCECYTCLNYSKAYLHHLIRTGEINGATLATIHNEYFIVQTVNGIRNAIDGDYYDEYKEECLYSSSKTGE